MANNTGFNFLNFFNVLLEVWLIFNNFYFKAFFNCRNQLGTYCNKLTIQIIWKILKHALNVGCNYAFNFLLYRRSCQTQNVGPLTIRITWFEFMVEEVPHYQIIKVVLVGVVALIKYHQCNFLHLYKTMHKKIIKLFCHCNKYIVHRKLQPPGLKLGVILTAALLSPEISPYHQISVSFNCRRLLLNQILNRNYEEYLLSTRFNCSVHKWGVWKFSLSLTLPGKNFFIRVWT